MRTLNFEADSLASTAGKILDVSQRTNATVESIEAEINNLQSSWQGTSNEALVKNINDEIVEIKKLLNNYETTGNNINRIANSLGENSEQNASSINAVKY